MLKLSCTSNILLYSNYEVYFKYTSGDILTSKVCNFMKITENNLHLYVSSLHWVHQEFSNEVYILQVYFEPVFEYFFDDSEVYLK